MSGDESRLSERIARLEEENKALELRIEGLSRDRLRYEHLIDGQRVLLRRISDEYREAQDQIAEQQGCLMDLADDLNRTISRLAIKDARLRKESQDRAEAEARLALSKDERLAEQAHTLLKANELLRQLPSKIIQAQEEERKTIARDLHDAIIQSFGVIRLFIENEMADIAESYPDYDLKHLTQIRDTAETALEEARRMIANLRPMVLDDYGLMAAVSWLLAEHRKLKPEIEVRAEFLFVEVQIPESLKVVVFRITQELLSNLRKHSRAKQAEMRFFVQGDTLRCVYNDDGVGLDPDETTGFGLISMRERAEMCGGSMAVHSIPKDGVTIMVDLPLR